ncbi:MAG: 3-deoxy-7-phosphoheptulonate synthase [Bacteroidetes bacterium]|nr:3-deoxy-7-phosphoheptulonate synthase [Bacteroidota bacterium]
MIIVLEKGVKDEQIEEIIKQAEDYGFSIHRSTGDEQILLGAIGIQSNFDTRKIKILEGVSAVYRVTEPFRLASRGYKKENTVINIGDVILGANEIITIAGPCAVESEKQIMTIAKIVKDAGAKILRGGAFKPRTSPYSFQGMEEEGLILLRKAGDEFGLAVITEVMDPTRVELIYKYTDIFQLGSRNMQNFPLLRELGRVDKPVMIKRGMSATIDEWLMAAEYILASGNENVMVCERGIRTFETSTRNTFDLSAIPVIHQRSHLPIIADPSHATGIRDKVIPMALAAVAAGTDGLMVEVHHDPSSAMSDGPQSLLPEQFKELMSQVRRIAEVIGRNA